MKRSFHSGDVALQGDEEDGARLWRSVVASEWRRIGRWTELFPWTPLGVLLTALAYAALEWLAYGELDLVWLVVGYVGLGLTLLAPLLVLVAAVWLRLSSDERVGMREREGSPLVLETETFFETGFARPSLWFLPLVQVRWEWLEPAGAYVDLARRDALLLERVRLSDRGHHERIERRMIVSDAFGLSRVRFRLHHVQPIDVLPRLGQLRVLPPLTALASGDALPHPLGLTDGDRLDLRRYGPGDPARFIHWKVMARTGKLMVRVPERALSIARRMAAYVIAGDNDDASCGAARLAIEQRALGLEWVLGTDAEPAGVTRMDQALEAIVQSSALRGARAGSGLAGFVDRVEQGGPASYVLFVPPEEGPWTAHVAKMARGRAVRIVIGIDGLTSVLPPSWWRRLLTVPSVKAGVDPARLEQLVAQLSALGASVSVLDRASGRVLGAAHLAHGLRAAVIASGGYVAAKAVELMTSAAQQHWLTRTPNRAGALEPTIAAWLRPLVYAAGAFVFAVPLARFDVALVIAAGALIGALLGRVVARTALRLYAIALLSLIGVVASAALRTWLVSQASLAEQLGPSSALELGDAVGWGLTALAASVGLRALALRVRMLRVLEVGFVGVAFAEVVAAHRGGAINRPFELADSIIAAGNDPTNALLAVGGVAAAVSVLLLLSEQSVLRSLLHVTVAAVLLFLVLSSTRMLGLPQPEAGKGALGLRPDDKDNKQGKPKHPGGSGSEGQPPSNDQLEFEDNYSSEGRQAPVAVVLLHDDYSPPNDLYYFRQAAFSQYNGRRLVVATMAGVDDDLVPAFVLEPQTLAPVPNVLDDRTTLETTVALLSEHNRPFALESPVSVTPASNPDPGRFRRVYRVKSAALASKHESLLGRGVGDPGWTDEQRAHYVEAPSDERFTKLADEIVAELPDSLKDDPVARGLMVSLWLGREGTYSLKSGHASASDPTADFLFGDRIGYCVHFAHAATFLMRALGIPSRVATGYAIEEAARQGGSAILLTGAHSHAWPEMYVTGVGWTVLDVYPEKSLDPPVQPPDPDLQRLLGEMARGTKPLPQGEDRPFEPVLAALRGLPELLGRIIGTLVPLILVLSYLIKLWRRFAPLFAGSSAPKLAYRAALDRLSEVALRRKRGETREAFAERLQRDAPLPSFTRLTGEHVRAYFGGGALATPAELRALSFAVARELGGNVPPLRRFRGVLNPFSWLRSR